MTPSFSKLQEIIGARNEYVVEGGLTDSDVSALTGLAERLGDNPLIVEVGSWAGCSTAILADSTHGGTVYAVDHWQGNEGTDSWIIAITRDMYSLFKKNMIALGLWNKIHPIRMTSQEAVKKFKDETPDF